MNVLMFGWEFPPYNSGGLGVACYGLARALSQSNVELEFVLPHQVDVSADFLHFIFADLKNVKLIQVPSLLYPYVTSTSYLKRLSQLSGHQIYGSSLLEEVERYAEEAKRIASDTQFDVIHAHDWLSFGAGVEAKETTGKPLVVHVHATEYDRTGGGSIDPRVYAIEREGIRRADRVIAVSNYTKRIIADHYDVDPNKITVVHNGIDAEGYEVNAQMLEGLASFKKMGYKIILYVGRITLQKGVDYFLHAAKMVHDRDPKTLFVVAGSGDMQNQIIRQTAELGLSNCVLFAGFVRGTELSRLYRSADLFVMPSVSEPFGLTALESMLHGTPVIVSKQSGVAEVVSSAMTVDFWDTQEMANKILGVVGYDSLQKTMAINGLRDAHRNGWSNAARKVIQIYNSL
jgi:glycogen(starch) synthase